MSGRQEPRSKHRHDPALEKHKKARQEMHPRFQPSSRRPTRVASSAAPQYAEGSGSSSSNTDTDTDEFRVESREERKRKSTHRGLDDDSSDEEQEIEEEEPVPPFQHQPSQGMHYGLLETSLPNVLWQNCLI